MRWSVLVLLVVACAPAAGAEEDPSATPIRAILLENDDAGLRKVYDGIRKGLELAALPRVGLETIQDTREAFVAYAQRVAQKPPPLLFAIGRKAGQRVAEVGIRVPCVFVDTCVRAVGEEMPQALAPVGPAAVVRGTTPATRWEEVVRGLFPGAEVPQVAVEWEGGGGTPAHAALAKLGGSRLSFATPVPPNDARARLHLRLGLGETLLPWSAVSPGLRLSDDVGHWGRGAVVVLAPDHRLLGRAAAEAGRRLLQEAPGGVLQVRTEVTEVRVDLEAAKAVGFDPPLAFVASADVVKGPKR